MADTDDQLEEIKGRVAYGLYLLMPQARWLIAQLEQAQKELAAARPYREFVEAMIADEPCNENCPLWQRCFGDEPDPIPERCSDMRDAWHAWQERKGK